MKTHAISNGPTMGFHILIAATCLASNAAAFEIDADLPALLGRTSVHDPATIQKEGERYYTFSTGRIVRSLSSPDLVNWTNGPSVFEAPPSWTTNAVPGYNGHTWAPDVIRVDDRYLLYYSVSTFGKQVSGIGVASSPTLDWDSPDYKWVDHGPVILSKEGDPYNAIDPALFQDEDGRLWMSFGSFWRGLYLFELNPETGKRLDEGVSPTRLAWAESIEAPFIMRRGHWYYLFVNHGRCCRGTNSTYEILVGRSRSITGPYLDRDGTDLVEAGGTEFLTTSNRFIGPGHVGVYEEDGRTWFSYHYYDERRRGRSHLALGRIDWTEDGWPTARVAPTDAELPPGQESERERR